ncbi:MAG TPA: TadE family protein [Microbacterium sp.]|nr:TadE family protein [Microbacterium sp.]
MMRRDGRDRTLGQSLVEFALVLPILLILMLGVLDFGRAIFAYNSVSNGARSGARVAIVNQDLDVITAAVEDEAFGLDDVDVSFDPNVEGVPDCPQTNVDCCPSIGCVIEVAVSTEYVPATPIFSQLVGSITVSSESQMPIERVEP